MSCKPFYSQPATLFVSLFLATLAFAGVPQTINYQGYLKNGTVPAGGSVNMTFSLYSSTRPGSGHVWQEKDKSITVTNGIYSTQLGSVTPITAPFDVPVLPGYQRQRH